MRRRNNPDANQAAIVDALRKIGAVVFLIGQPFDLLCALRGKLYLLEIKNPVGKDKLEDSQKVDILRLNLVGVKFLWFGAERRPFRASQPSDMRSPTPDMQKG